MDAKESWILAQITSGMAQVLGGNRTEPIKSDDIPLSLENLVKYYNEMVLTQEISAKYRILLENAFDIILFARMDGQLTEANRAAERAYGLSRDELLASNIYDIHIFEDRLQVERHIKEAGLRGITYESEHYRKDGSSFPVEISVRGIIAGNEIILVYVIRDISDRKRIEDKLRYYASYDSLTQIPNRYVLENTFEQMVAKVNQQAKIGALLLIDIDNFKFINDTFGHNIGDMVLVHLVSVLKGNLREDDLLSRLGGDEFAVLLNKVSMSEAIVVAEKLRRAVEKTRICPNNCEVPFSFTVSIGVAPVQNGEVEFREIAAQADFALYQSKERGRNRVSWAPSEKLPINKFNETNDLMLTIRDALDKDRLVLFFQPIVNISTGETVYYEALMRIVTEAGKVIYPGKAIPIAERFGLMPSVDRRIVELAFRTLLEYPEIKLFINLSGASIGNEDILLLIEDKINKTGIDPSRLGFEITETMAVKDLIRADRWIKQLRERGCRFTLDDFGIGFSSFSYLQYLSVDYVKIDGSYIHDIDKNNKNRALVQAVNTVARSLNIEVIAEFVENSAVMDVLKEDRVSNAQGYYLGYPEEIPKPVSIPSK